MGLRSDLKIFDQRKFEHLLIVNVPNNNRNFFESRYLRGLIPTFTGNNLIFRAILSHEERLQDTILAN